MSMETLHLVVALSAGMVGMLSFVLPIFNKGLKDELELLKKEKSDLEAAAERFEKRLQEKDKKLLKLRQELEGAQGDLEQERRNARSGKGDAKKIQEIEEGFRRKEHLLERRLNDGASVLKEIQEELLAQKQLVASSSEDLAAARAALEVAQKEVAALKTRLEAAVKAQEKAPPTASPVPPVAAKPVSAAPVDEDELDHLRKQVKQLKKDLKSNKFSEATIKRKLEHNRRAYLVTMMQLDLAQDELCLLKTGKPRRQTTLARQQQPGLIPETECMDDDNPPETVEELLDDAMTDAPLEDAATPIMPEEQV
jgi:DNA repair exonuclease SbcCD ATPase subunit